MSATLPRTSMSTIDENLKRFFDCIASICGMIVFSPLFLIIMIIIKCDSKGPVIISQERIGKGGKPKLCQENDERLTKVGKFLRDHHLDELPQLWCVARGDMSFVGPRPERKYYIDKIMEVNPGYERLYELRPGLFSEATLTNGYTGTLEKMLTRLEMDLDYLENRSLWRDTQIIFKTVTSILSGKIF